MKERPIPFSAPMVRAILAGTKTQTRRVVKPQFPVNAVPAEMPATDPIGGWVIDGHSGMWWCDAAANPDRAIRCRYGQPGDRLWVKETTLKVEDRGWIGPVYAESEQGRFALDWGYCEPDDFDHIPPHEIKLRPSIFMSRAMSRITLEVTGVRVERLQDISEADAIAEGVLSLGQQWEADAFPDYFEDLGVAVSNGTKPPIGPSPRDRYAMLWNQINGRGSWDANAWVWVVEFRRISPATI